MLEPRDTKGGCFQVGPERGLGSPSVHPGPAGHGAGLLPSPQRIHLDPNETVSLKFPRLWIVFHPTTSWSLKSQIASQEHKGLCPSEKGVLSGAQILPGPGAPGHSSNLTQMARGGCLPSLGPAAHRTQGKQRGHEEKEEESRQGSQWPPRPRDPPRGAPELRTGVGPHPVPALRPGPTL